MVGALFEIRETTMLKRMQTSIELKATCTIGKALFFQDLHILSLTFRQEKTSYQRKRLAWIMLSVKMNIMFQKLNL